MRLVVHRPVALPVDRVRRALADPAALIEALAPRLEPLPPEPGMTGHWRISVPLAGLAREVRVWLPAHHRDDGCQAAARMDGVAADFALLAAADGVRATCLRAEVTVAAAGLRGRALMAMLVVAEPALRARVGVLLDRLSAHLAAQAA